LGREIENYGPGFNYCGRSGGEYFNKKRESPRHRRRARYENQRRTGRSAGVALHAGRKRGGVRHDRRNAVALFREDFTVRGRAITRGL